MPEVKILVVEDEPSIVKLLEFTLTQAAFQVQTAASAEEAQTQLDACLPDLILPDLILLDWMLPGMSGAQFARQLRAAERTCDLPIILLTARSEEADKEHGLNLGADDYVTKPFSPRELVARINALLRRRAPQKTEERITVQNLTLDPAQHSVSSNGQAIPFGPTEFKLLHFFMTHTNRIYSRRQLLDLVWGDHVFIEERTVDVHIRRLRKGLESVGLENMVQTVRGSGYRFSTLPEQA